MIQGVQLLLIYTVPLKGSIKLMTVSVGLTWQSPQGNPYSRGLHDVTPEDCQVPAEVNSGLSQPSKSVSSASYFSLIPSKNMSFYFHLERTKTLPGKIDDYTHTYYLEDPAQLKYPYKS